MAKKYLMVVKIMVLASLGSLLLLGPSHSSQSNSSPWVWCSCGFKDIWTSENKVFCYDTWIDTDNINDPSSCHTYCNGIQDDLSGLWISYPDKTAQKQCQAWCTDGSQNGGAKCESYAAVADKMPISSRRPPNPPGR